MGCSGYDQIKSDQIRSNQIKSDQIRSNQIKSDQIRSNQIKSDQIRSNQIKSDQIRSNQIKFSKILAGESINRRSFFKACPYFILGLSLPLLKKPENYIEQIIFISAANRSFSSYKEFKLSVFGEVVQTKRIQKLDVLLSVFRKKGDIIKENYFINGNKAFIRRLWSSEAVLNQWVKNCKQAHHSSFGKHIQYSELYKRYGQV